MASSVCSGKDEGKNTSVDKIDGVLDWAEPKKRGISWADMSDAETECIDSDSGDRSSDSGSRSEATPSTTIPKQRVVPASKWRPRKESAHNNTLRNDGNDNNPVSGDGTCLSAGAAPWYPDKVIECQADTGAALNDGFISITAQIHECNGVPAGPLIQPKNEAHARALAAAQKYQQAISEEYQQAISEEYPQTISEEAYGSVWPNAWWYAGLEDMQNTASQTDALQSP